MVGCWPELIEPAIGLRGIVGMGGLFLLVPLVAIGWWIGQCFFWRQWLPDSFGHDFGNPVSLSVLVVIGTGIVVTGNFAAVSFLEAIPYGFSQRSPCDYIDV